MKLFSLYRSYWWRSWAITWNCTLLGQKPFSRWFKIVQIRTHSSYMLGYSLKTLQMAWLGDQVAIWGEDPHHRLGLWALHQHHRHPQPTPWWHRCADWPCSGNCTFWDEDYKRKHIQQCYILCLQLTPPPPHANTKRKERKQFLGIVSWVCLHAARRPYRRLHACRWSRGEWISIFLSSKITFAV